MTLTLGSANSTQVTPPQDNDLPLLGSLKPRLPRRLFGAPHNVCFAELDEGTSKERKREGLQTLLIDILPVVLNTASFVCFDNGSYLWVRAVFRPIITLYERLLGFLPTCSAAPEWQSEFNRRTSSGETVLRLSLFS